MGQGKLKRKLGLLDLTMLGIGSIIGSGWLYASMRGANYAGSLACSLAGMGNSCGCRYLDRTGIRGTGFSDSKNRRIRKIS